MTTIHLGIFHGRSLWADGVSADELEEVIVDDTEDEDKSEKSNFLNRFLLNFLELTIYNHLPKI